MPYIVPIVEGHGDVKAVPILVRRIIQEHIQAPDWQCDHPIRAGNLAYLSNNLERYLRLALLKPKCSGVLILLDLDDGCPKEEACRLAERIRKLSPPKPVAVVLAHREYEAWFVASLESLAGQYGLPEGIQYVGDPEAKRGVKEWLTAQMPKGESYDETYHQPRMTAKMDIDSAYSRSRSFRRLLHAVGQIVQASGPCVTPDRCGF